MSLFLQEQMLSRQDDTHERSVPRAPHIGTAVAQKEPPHAASPLQDESIVGTDGTCDPLQS